MELKKSVIVLILLNIVVLTTSISIFGSIISLILSIIFLVFDLYLIYYFGKLKKNYFAKLVFILGLSFTLITIFYSPLGYYISDIWNISKAEKGFAVTYQNQVIGTILSWIRELLPLNAFLISKIK